MSTLNQINRELTVMTLFMICLTACRPSEERKTMLAEKRRIECLDRYCEGDVQPQRDVSKETIIKLNGQWYIGPRTYFVGGNRSAKFVWWGHEPREPWGPRTSEMAKLVSEGRSDEFTIEIFLRSTDIPQGPRGYKLIAFAQAHDWIASRTILRPGLEVVKMKHVMGPDNYFIDYVPYYIATDLRGLDGLPPVATCDHSDPKSIGGSGFMWQPGVWAGIRMNQKHCIDWPEIYQETMRILGKLRKAEI